MKITGEELYVAWKKWVDSEETRKTPFVIQSETWWGDERYVLVRDIYRGWSVQVHRLEVIMRRYGFFNFLFDVFMVSVTGGFWLIWIFIREMRRG